MFRFGNIPDQAADDFSWARCLLLQKTWGQNKAKRKQKRHHASPEQLNSEAMHSSACVALLVLLFTQAVDRSALAFITTASLSIPTTPPLSTAEHARWASGSTGPVFSSPRNPSLEIIDTLFPRSGDAERPSEEKVEGGENVASYAQRLQAGRAAQGFMTSDGLAVLNAAPPQELTYGEYDLDFFFSLVDECLRIRAGGDGNGGDALESEARNLVFGDIGSGCGRLVLAQALTLPWRLCRGVEKVQSLHDMAVAALRHAGKMAEDTTASSESSRLLKTMAPCTLSLGDVNDEVDISDIDVLFCYSSSFPAYGDLLTEFSYTLGHKLRPGAQVITTDRRLVSDGPWEFALLGEREGPNSETGGKSTAYLWEVVKSAL